MADDERTAPVRSLLRRATDPAERSTEPRLRRWVLLDGDRKHVSGVLLIGVFVALSLLAVVWPIEYQQLLTDTNTVQTVFNTLLGGVILLVSIVVAIASVGISQELTSLGDQDDRIETAIGFRGTIEDRSEIDISPARPSQVVVVLLRIIQRRAHDLDATPTESTESDIQEDLDDLGEDIKTNVAELSETLSSIQPGTTDELLVGLDYDATWQLHQTYWIRRRHAGRLSDEQKEVLDDLGTALQDFMTSREYFKTLYYEREFADLSTVLLVVSLPVIVFITYVLLALDASLFPEFDRVGVSPLTVFVNLAYTISLVPYVVLTAYVLRAATVTRRASAVGPFVLESDRDLTTDTDVLEDDAEA